ncbi:unnamed protein product [Linum tenue]|uniref:beta-galactosidase n=1 Tax=Linum tenue TaxID=586396 RepID=A0AAV0PFB2_9ROSI|nr:unnamed protein product [Linum tenue]
MMVGVAAENVTYDGRSLFINGRRHLIISGSIHYPRSTPEYYMEKFMTYIVNLMKQEKLFASQGEKGPIIMTQVKAYKLAFVENEFEYLEQIYPEGKNYVNWAGEMAISQHTSVPWIMCGESDAPGPVIGTCNDFYCDDFQLASDKPKIWTENWTGWLPTYWAPKYHRPSRDSAFAVARFFQKGGSVVNYYMVI